MRHKPLIHLGIVSVVLVVLISIYSAWFVAVDTQSAKAHAVATELQTKRQDTERIAAAKAALNALASDEDAIATHLVSTTDVVPFLESLQSTGSRLGSRVDVLSVSAEPGKSHGKLLLTVRITGSFDAVTRTLGALEYSPYDITLTNLTLDTPGAAGKSARIWNAAAAFSVGTATTTTPKRVAPVPPVSVPTTSSTSIPKL